jgi:beta-glucosidase
MDKYKDPKASIEQRVDDLLVNMNLDEKIAQLGGIWAMEVLQDSRFSVDKARALMKNGMGQICRAGVGTALRPDGLIKYVNDLQRFLVENTRLGIPAIIHEECLSGFMAKDATIFPQSIGLASTWDPSLVERMASVISRQMMTVGVRQGLSPVLDVARDPRWGRIEETFGEDPYLTARLGVAYVRGLQGRDIRDGVIATLKHFAGHGKSEGGLNHAPADIPPRMMREVYLYPFEKAIRVGRALSVMNAYNEIDGIPVAASGELLTRILRDEWGFEGLVVSDYFAVLMLQTFHHVVSTREEAAMLALGAGLDQELPRHDCLSAAFANAVAGGKFPERTVDLAVRRVLKMKFALGLFDAPFIEQADTRTYFDTAEQRGLALESARKSIVLLKNENSLLPLDINTRTIAIVGPNANSPRNQLGDYTYAGHVGIMDLTANSLGCTLPENELDENNLTVPVISVFDGIRAKVPAGCNLLYARGCEVGRESEEGFQAAIEAARSADVAIVVVGGKSGQMPDCTCGEMRDRADLDLPPVQDRLVRAVFETGTPIVLVIVDGRPISLGWIAEKIPAIVEAWLPGEEGGNAVADVVFGDYNPAGRLPVSFPHGVGQVPVYYGVKPSGGKSQFWGNYVDLCTAPLYEFGYGLSYTTFEYSNLRIIPQQVKRAGLITIKVDVTNTGEVPGDEVVQLYVNDVIASVTRPVKQLKGFRRVNISNGGMATVTFTLPVDELAFYGIDMKKIVEPGLFKVMVGKSSSDIILEGQFEVVD